MVIPSFIQVNVSGGEPSDIHVNVSGAPITPETLDIVVVITGAAV